jgi:hypothetical protein
VLGLGALKLYLMLYLGQPTAQAAPVGAGGVLWAVCRCRPPCAVRFLLEPQERQEQSEQQEQQACPVHLEQRTHLKRAELLEVLEFS